MVMYACVCVCVRVCIYEIRVAGAWLGAWRVFFDAWSSIGRAPECCAQFARCAPPLDLLFFSTFLSLFAVFSVAFDKYTSYDTLTTSSQEFPGERILTYMEFQLDSAEYCQAQHK